MKKSLLFVLLSSLLFSSVLMFSGCSTPEDEAQERRQAYEEGYEAGQQSILEDPGAYELTTIDPDDYRISIDDAYNEGYSEGYEEGSKEGYLACLENYGIEEEGW